MPVGFFGDIPASASIKNPLVLLADDGSLFFSLDFMTGEKATHCILRYENFLSSDDPFISLPVTSCHNETA